MKKIILLLLLLTSIAVAFSCSGSDPSNPSPGGDTPTEAYKRLFKAVKSKNTEAIKKELTKATISFGKGAAQQYNKTEEQLFENGFTATTFSESLPTIRDERIKDNMGAIEVWNSKDSNWEDLPFMLEDGMWKLAVGEMFSSAYKSPGKGRDVLEKEAANAINGNNMKMIPAPPINGAPPKPIVPKEAKDANK